MPVSSAARTSSGLFTTYSTSYGGAGTSSVRGNTGQKSSILNGYSSSSTGAAAYSRPRPLPPGPGPLDSIGRKYNSYNVSSVLDTGLRRNRTPSSGIGTSTRTGPIKADHTSSFVTTTSRYDVNHARTTNYTSITSHQPSEPRPLSGTSRTRRSNSLADLNNLSINSSSNHPRSLNNGLNSNSSSRNGFYHRDSDDLYGGRSSRVTMTSGLEAVRPDGTSRTRYTPSMSRESSPTTRRMLVAANERDSPPKSTASSGSSSAGGMTRYRDGGKVGLRNLGNTCFMNCVLQCLSNTRVLIEYCVEEKYHLEINTTTSNMKGALFKAYAHLMQCLWKERGESVSPNSFKTQIQKFAPRFMGYAQQDCQEFLRYLLEGLHEDVNRVTKKPAPIILDDEQLDKKNDSGKAQDYWKTYINRDNSMIVDIFVGQLKSELKFSSCNHRSVTFDPFWDLSLPIPKNRSHINIDDCIRLFMKEEELADQERPMCAKCKERRACTKSFSIQRFPKILVLHLKRFSQERFGRKLTANVDFPNSLDLTDYAAEGGGRRVLYDLYGVANHSGSIGSGHYTAYCKNPYSGEWYFYNDSRVTPARSNQVVSSEAYVLFYELHGQSGKA